MIEGKYLMVLKGGPADGTIFRTDQVFPFYSVAVGPSFEELWKAISQDIEPEFRSFYYRLKEQTSQDVVIMEPVL